MAETCDRCGGDESHELWCDREPPELEAVRSATFTLFGVEVRCHVLSDGQRIIEGESFERLLRAAVRAGH